MGLSSHRQIFKKTFLPVDSQWFELQKSRMKNWGHRLTIHLNDDAICDDIIFHKMRNVLTLH